MKRTLLLIAVLILTGACATPPPANREATPSAAASPAAVAMTEADAIAKEKAIWDTIKNKDYDAFGNMLADDMIEVTGEANLDKAGAIAGVKDFEPTEVVFSDWKFLSIDKDAFVVIYTANVKAKVKGKESPPQSARCSSSWVKRAGKWLAIYHQECELKPAMTMPPSKVEKAAASPTSTPAAAPATGPDPIANERIVWDLFKAKNYDAFGDLLVTDFIEVEPFGVYDKAGSVEGVSTFDASKAVLSDLKSVNLDDDAALVTYTVNNPANRAYPKGERHSSIWVKRDGKWLGLFHHGGTPVSTPPKPPASPAATAP
jgi:hypothetical protein